jgi:hypothetical protein
MRVKEPHTRIKRRVCGIKHKLASRDGGKPGEGRGGRRDRPYRHHKPPPPLSLTVLKIKNIDF